MKSTKKKSVIFANIIIGGMVTIFILAITYLFYQYSTLQNPISLKLFILFIAGLLFSIFALFIRDSWKINVAAIIFSVMIAAYGVELVLFAQYKIHFTQAKIDTRNKLEVLEDLRAEGDDAWPQVLASLFIKNNGVMSDNNRLFPLGGISQKTIVYCNESGQYKIFKSDEHGLNNPKDLYRKGAVTTVLIGDSFAIGSCVKSEEEIAGRLRNMGINSVNLGNGGNGPLIELAGLKEYAEHIQPEIVLWLYFEGNDLHDLKNERSVPMLMRYLEDDYSQNLLNRQDEIDRTLIKYVNSEWTQKTQTPQMRRLIENQPVIEHKREEKENRLKPLKLWYLRDRIGLFNKPGKLKRKVTFNSQLQLFSKILALADNRSSGWGGKLYFVYLPEMERYVGDNDNGAFFDRDDVLAIVHELGIPVIDFHDVLDKHPEPLSLTPFLGAHYNAQGYKLLSEFIVDRLKQDRLISGE